MPGPMTATSTSEPRSLALGGDPDALRAWAEDAGRELGEALRTVLGALPGAGEGPIELAKRLGLNRDVAGRVLLSVPRPPLEVLADIPGPEPLRRFLAAARRAGAGEAAVERAARAVEDFQALIRDGCGTRDGLTALLSGSVREVRERLELAARSASFKGASQLAGVGAELWVDLKMFAATGGEPHRCDVAMVSGPVGLRRLRPDAAVQLRSMALRPPSAGGGVIFGLGDLAAYCPNRAGECEIERIGDDVAYRLVDRRIGPQGLMDVLAGEVRRSLLPTRYDAARLAEREGVLAYSAVNADVPAQTLVSDLFVEEGLYGAFEPVPVVLRNVGSELVPVFGEPASRLRVEPLEAVEPLGPGPEDWAFDAFPAYGAMVRHVGERLAGGVRVFRGYRLRVPYPVATWQYAIALRAG